ncbi:hypothetical protein RR47_GL000746 [Enterococcus columbae DSM 7374 = ATCC 51263]|nr:hypothetical protein RR47_GL000746 [Enterococcus columbae DSM 7374 = ATCC 51263]
MKGVAKMYFSGREKTILSLMLEYPNGITLDELQSQLQISRRTLYREIASIEKTIQTLDIQIIKPRGAGYRIVGESDNLDKLRQQLSQKQEEIFADNVKRQSAIVCSLLLQDEEVTIESLAIDFRVSIGTIVSDLQTIELSLQDYQLSLLRLKGRGIKIDGQEKAKRQILGNLIFNGVSEYDFYHYLDTLEEHTLNRPSQHFFLDLLSADSLYLAKKSFYQLPQNILKNATDNQLQRVLILLALSIDRMRSNHWLNLTEGQSPRTDSIQLANQLMVKVAQHLQCSIPSQEVNLFAYQLEGINYKQPQNIFLDAYDVELSYKIKEFIRFVSQDSGYDFRKDEQLFNDLMAHMSAAIKRVANTLNVAPNPLLMKVTEKYQWITKAVEAQLKNVFSQYRFSFDEIGYIVIHFATSLERYPISKDLSVLVICSSGIGTARILESRIRKYLPEFKKVQIGKISQMSQINYKDYDLILATIFLPGFTLPYKVISPLLLEDEISEIRSQLYQLKPAQTVTMTEVTPINMESRQITELSFQEVYETMRVANQLLSSFDLKKVQSQATIEATLAQIITELTGTIVNDAAEVTQRVIDRYLIAPIGIPQTNMALFHCADEEVKEPLFAIYELDQTFSIPSMDRKGISLQRILLMLAPEPMPESQKALLGKISSSIIESDLNTEIYMTGSKEKIYELLSTLFVNEVRKK